ncbi:Fic family protein [Thalassomonas actiniarum]|uniref:Fic family protein n=1 Tax=Thalassomonas actiniarum TaxID=485447 RepID=A0AAF0C0Q7_9GAMM|nr:Fic family protein [Thalassomonas actiniarum]WDD98511.1 Fic family protein [Thalassomonas actiniarum]
MSYKDQYIERYAGVETVERKHGDKQETIICIIPPTLAEQEIKLEIAFDLNNFKQGQYGEFSLNGFLNRYLAGSRSLKESRSVSRKRLALVSSQIGFVDPEAIDLVTQMARYQQAREILAANKRLNLKVLLDVNRLLEAEHKKAGNIRKNQNWIGGKSPMAAYYVCPPAEQVEALINDWLGFVNNADLAEDVIAIVGHNQLLNIHPFADGNGRTGRVFLQSRLEQKYGDIIHPSLYRLHKQKDTYIEAIQSTLRAENFSAPVHDYWQESLSWGDRLKRRMYQILADGQAKLNGRLAMRALSANGKKLLDHLWVQPIVCEKGLFKHFGWDFFTAQAAIQELINCKILEARRLRQPEGAIIYDCPLMFATWQQLDDAIFLKEEETDAA